MPASRVGLDGVFMWRKSLQDPDWTGFLIREAGAWHSMVCIA